MGQVAAQVVAPVVVEVLVEEQDWGWVQQQVALLMFEARKKSLPVLQRAHLQSWLFLGTKRKKITKITHSEFIILLLFFKIYSMVVKRSQLLVSSSFWLALLLGYFQFFSPGLQ